MKFLSDFFPVLLFFAAYFIGERNAVQAQEWAARLLGGIVRDGLIPPEQAAILLATALAIVAITIQLVVMLALRKKIGIMQWTTFVIFLGFGGATIYFHNDSFIKWKPTVLYWLFGVVLLVSNTFFKRNLIRQMMEPGGLLLPDPIWRQVNLAWIGFFSIVGVVNLYIAFNFSRDTWVSFKAFGLTGLTFAFAIGQALLLSRHMSTPEDAGEQANVNKS